MLAGVRAAVAFDRRGPRDVAVTRPQSAATVDPGLYGGMRWRSVGPARGGRSIAVGGSDARPQRVLVRRHRRRRLEDHRRRHQLGADDRRQDHHLVDRLARRLPVQSRRRLHRRRRDRSSAATSSRATASTRPTDGGKTWTHLPQLRDSQAIARLRVHPTNCDIVYAAVFGQVYNDHPQRGVFKSTDGGKTLASRRCSRREDRRRSTSRSIRRTRT